MSTWTSIRDDVVKILPYAAGAVNPALGAVLAAALGTSNTPDAVQAALTSDPQAQEKILAYEVQIKQIVANQAVADQQAQVALAQSDAASQDSARRLAEAKNYTPQVVLSAIFITGYFGITFLVVYVLFFSGINLKDINPAVLAIVASLLGVLTASVVQIMNFWFGSSHGSQKKDDTIAQAALAP